MGESGADLPHFTGKLVVVESIWWYRIPTILALTSGTLLLMWLGEQITERGIGNGVSLITIGIVSDLPIAGQSLYMMFFQKWGHQIQRFSRDCAAAIIGRGCRRGHRCDPGATKIPSSTPARRWTKGLLWRQFVHAFAGQLRRRHADYLRSSHPDVSQCSSRNLDRFPPLSFRGYWQRIEPRPVAVLHSLHVDDHVLSIWVATQFNELQISDDLKRMRYIPGVRRAGDQ